MDEELNRIIIDNLSDIRFCPSNFSKKNILLENKNLKNNYVVGNTIIDVLKEMTIPHEKNEFAKDGILTLHRKQLVDDFEMLYKTLKKIDIFCGKIKKQIIFPIHPRTLKI